MNRYRRGKPYNECCQAGDVKLRLLSVHKQQKFLCHDEIRSIKSFVITLQQRCLEE